MIRRTKNVLASTVHCQDSEIPLEEPNSPFEVERFEKFKALVDHGSHLTAILTAARAGMAVSQYRIAKMTLGDDPSESWLKPYAASTWNQVLALARGLHLEGLQ